MKKIILILSMAISLMACGSGSSTTSTAEPSATTETVTITNSVDFNTTKADMSGYKWLYDSEPAFVEITLEESIRMFSEGGSGILYYGYSGCPWCERAVPILNSVAKELGVTIYYINVHAQTTMEAYNELVTYIEDIFEVDSTTGEKEFKVPEVIAVKNGEITDHHLALVDGFKIESDESQMDDSQKEELRTIYYNLIESAKD